MNKWKPFNPVNIKVKKPKYSSQTSNPPIESYCHYCKLLLESCKCDDQFFYEKYMNI